MSPGRCFSLLTLILALFGSALFSCGRASAQGTPVLAFSTFLGGSNYDIGEAIAIDDDGNLYVAGYTYSANFPVGPPYPGTYDGFVAKFSPTGQLLDTTFLGGSGQDYCLGVAVRGGYVYVTGATDSDDFPDNLKIGDDLDAFVVKLDKATLTQEYAVRLGGSGDDQGYAVSVNQDDGIDYAYVAGSTTPVGSGAPFPITADAFQPNHGGGYWDGFVSKIAPDGTLAYSTYLGGNGDDEAYGIYAGQDGVVYVTGWTGGIFPVTASAYQSTIKHNVINGPRDAFLTVLDTSISGGLPSLLYSTYLGGNDWDYGMAVTADGAGKAYVAGMTRSTAGFPCTHNYGPTGNVFEGGSFDGFVAKFDPTQSGVNSLLASAYLGGSGSDRCMGVKVAPATGGGYEVYLTGDTSSANFLGKALKIRKGCPEVFLVKLAANWSLSPPASYVAFLTGSNIDYGRALDVRRTGSITTIGLTGGTSSNNFTTKNPIDSYGGSYDAFVARFEEAN